MLSNGLIFLTLLNNFLIFCMTVEDNRANRLSPIVCLKKILILDCRGLTAQRRWLFDFFDLFSKTALQIFLIFYMSVEDNEAHQRSQNVFLKRS